MTAARHSIFDNKVQLFQRPNSPFWWASCSIAGQQERSSTREESLARAKDVARDWYLTRLGKLQQGEFVPREKIASGRKFKEASAEFIDEFAALTEHERSPIYIRAHRDRIKNHLDPFFGNMLVTKINEGAAQAYLIDRMKTGLSRKDQFAAAKASEDEKFVRVKPPARTTLHQELVCLRQILKSEHRKGHIKQLPVVSAPYRASNKIAHRAWFSPEEYKTLYERTRKYAQKPPKSKGAKRWPKRTHVWGFEQLHDLVLFMGNTGLRPDEALGLQFRDVEIVEDKATKKTILEISVRGKRGVGYCKSMPGAVEPFRRLQKRLRPTRTELKSNDGNEKGSKSRFDFVQTKSTDSIFPKTHHDIFERVLDELDLKTDREGNPRTLYSLRHTYISMRLMEGADIYQIAKNCRTSVEMIEKYYASHIKDRLDTSAINVLKPRKRKRVAPASGKKGKSQSDGGSAPPAG